MRIPSDVHKLKAFLIDFIFHLIVRYDERILSAIWTSLIFQSYLCECTLIHLCSLYKRGGSSLRHTLGIWCAERNLISTELMHAIFFSLRQKPEVSCFPILTCLYTYHIYIQLVMYLFRSRDNYFENLENTTVLTCKMFTSSFHQWPKKVTCLGSQLCSLIGIE